VEAALRHERVLECARLLAGLELHGKREPDDEVAARLARRTGLDGSTAEHEVVSIARRPQDAVGFLAYLEILRLEERLRADGLDERDAVTAVLVALTLSPSARPADLAALLDRRAEEAATGGDGK
jgi:hypothetical protein